MSEKSIKLEAGSAAKDSKTGVYFYRYQINGRRKSKRSDNKSQRVYSSCSSNNYRNNFCPCTKSQRLEKLKQKLLLSNAWQTYINHPERATPATIAEEKGYEGSFKEFVKFAEKTIPYVHDVNSEVTDLFAKYLRKTPIPVSTHNRKLKETTHFRDF